MIKTAAKTSVQTTDEDDELTPMQRAFVNAMVATGGNQRAAARAAGYAVAGADGIASRMVRNPLIGKAIAHALHEALGVHAVSALSSVAKLSRSAKSEYVKLEAARDILDRAGFKPPDRVDHRVDQHLSVSIDLGDS